MCLHCSKYKYLLRHTNSRAWSQDGGNVATKLIFSCVIQQEAYLQIQKPSIQQKEIPRKHGGRHRRPAEEDEIKKKMEDGGNSFVPAHCKVRPKMSFLVGTVQLQVILRSRPQE